MADTSVEERARTHERRWLTLGVLCLSLVLITLDNTIVNVALPTLVRELDADTAQLQWIVDSYVLVFAGLLLTAGSLGDRYGRRRALTFGLGLFAVAAILSSLSTTADQLIATRALMGFGGAFVMPSTLSILTNVFTDPVERGRAIAIWAGVAGVGIGLGPVAGGWLLEHFWWGSVFLVNVPVVAVALLGGRLFIPESSDPSRPRLDPAGAVLSIVGLTALVWTIIEAPDRGWTDPVTAAGFAVAGVLLVAFALWERRIDHPMLDVAFFRDARFSAGSASITIVFFALLGSIFLVTLLLQFVMGYGALEAGVRLLPVALIMMVAAPLSARLVERLGTKAVVTTGMVTVGVGLGALSTFGDGSGYALVLISLALVGLGMGLTMPPATEAIMGSLPPARAGVGSAVNDTTRQVGGALGVAVLGSILASGYGPNVSDALAGAPLPPAAAEAARDSLGAAIGLADQMGGAPGQALAAAARTGFVDAMGPALLLAAGVALIGAALAVVYLPARAMVRRPEGPEPPTPDEEEPVPAEMT